MKLRFIERQEIDLVLSARASQSGSYVVKDVRILQFKANALSEWQDVPLVTKKEMEMKEHELTLAEFLASQQEALREFEQWVTENGTFPLKMERWRWYNMLEARADQG